ncbi:hypothetical protein LOD99_12032 [Oopsacas minuta]|uniref:Transposase n=1 Tax=Oopsacas minuta TaxID=111878 RepID=A0AAV7JH75_9METZ|nr:hypothetical protein LOD99_12032 [Oopsacas minuta]
MSQLEQRKKIKIFIDAGITSAKEISAKTGIPLRTIFRIKSILREGKSITHKSVSGRPKAITYSHKQSIIRTLNSHSKISIRSVHANLSSKYTDAPSTSTVYRATRACGFNFKQPVMGPFITPLIAKNRVEWCKDHVNYCWENVFFTDECSIWLNRGSVGMWTRAKENPILKVQRHTPKLHIWGGISSMGTTILKIFTSNFVSKLYIDTLNECLIRTADVYYPEGWILQEDNSPIHKSKLSKEWKDSENILVLDWPAYSPDLNPIENIWGVLKQRLSKRSLNNLADLEVAIIYEWETFTPDFLKNFILSMPNSVNMCINSRGEKINY